MSIVSAHSKHYSIVCYCVSISSGLHVQHHHIGSLKLTTVEVVTPLKLPNATHQGLKFLEIQLLNIYWNTIEFHHHFFSRK